MDKQRQDDQLEPTYNSSVPIQDVALKTYLNCVETIAILCANKLDLTHDLKM